MHRTIHHATLFAFVLLATQLLTVPVAAAAANHPFPQNLEYAQGTLLPDHLSLTELNDDVRAAYQRWRDNYLAAAGNEADGQPRYRVRMGTSDSQPTVSEGQGYGMLVVVLMAEEGSDAQTVFDGLWEFFKDHPSESDSRLMDWHVPADESSEPGWDSSAFDGDNDIALALLLADAQWGSDGRVDYRLEYDILAAAIMESTIGPESRLPMLGDWVEADGSTYNQYTTRTSDLMSDHFRVFAAATGNRDWLEVVRASQALVASLQAAYSPLTGLLPDFAIPLSDSDHSPRPAPPGFLEGPHDGHYYYNAGRDPWRIGTDAAVNGDPFSKTQAQTISVWVREETGGFPTMIRGGYHLDGTPIGNYFSSFFAAPFGVAAMVDPDAQEWLNLLFDTVKRREEGYFEDTVTLLCLLVMSHNYWTPLSLPGLDPMGQRPAFVF